MLYDRLALYFLADQVSFYYRPEMHKFVLTAVATHTAFSIKNNMMLEILKNQHDTHKYAGYFDSHLNSTKPPGLFRGL